MVGKIYISGLIGTYGEEKGVELIDVISQVRKQPEATSYEVYINSEGGVVDTGFDIYNFIKSLGYPVTTIGTGMVASIATVIFMAGQKRIVQPKTQFMIHLPMGGIEFATADEMEMHTKGLREVENKVIQFYTKELSLNKEAISPLLRNETWLNESQLIDLGFVTVQSQIKIAARAILNKPKTNKTMTKKSKFQAILDILTKKEIVNKVIFSADQKELNFPDLAEDAMIEVGATATYDGVPAEGEITGADGKIYVFAAGTLTEIKDPSQAEEDVTEEQMLEALTATLEVATQLETRVEALETETIAIKKERDEFKVKLDSANLIIAKLKGSSKPAEEDKQDKKKENEGAASIVAQWKQDKFKKN